MISIQTLAVFFGASAMLGIAPGPDNIFVLTQAATNGKRAGLIVTAGLCTGLLVHTTAVAFGVSVIFKTSAMAFTVLKTLGACYLLYLAWQAIRNARKEISPHDSGKLTAGQFYRRGVIMNLTNPKVALFFLAFLPQFADPKNGSVPLQMMVLGGVFIFATIIVFGSISLLAGAIGQWFSRSTYGKQVINYLAGFVFLGLALKLAITER